MRAIIAGAAMLWASASTACDTALLLAVDVSNSIDAGEYRLQVDGMADALLDPVIADTLVQGQMALMVVQWSGRLEQDVSIPWTRITSPGALQAFAAEARSMKRRYINSDTAPGEALTFAISQFSEVSDCAIHIIDLSGDGTANSAGAMKVGPVARGAERLGISINAIAIESSGLAITNYFRRNIITRNGFVMTARGHRDYPRAIKEKILREISKVTG